MSFSLVLFDVDGTLVDTAGAGRRALETAFRSVLGIDDIVAPSAKVRFEGKTDPRIIEEIAAAAGVDGGRLGRASAPIREAYLEALRVEMSRNDPRRRVLPGVRRLLEHLASRTDVTLGLLTGNIEAGARIKLEPFGLNRFFPTGGFACDDSDRNVIARIACERLSRLTGRSFEPGNVTVVGDTEHDVACARANGYRALAVLTGWTSRDRLAEVGPDMLLEDLSDLSRVLAALALGPPRSKRRARRPHRASRG